MEKYTISNGVAIRYADFGKGEKVILLVHGYLESMEVWDTFAGILGKTYHILMLDLPGSGMSDYGGQPTISMAFMAETTAQILEKCNIPSVTVVGHSMGGYVALALSKYHPALVEKLVLLHSSPNADTPEKKDNRLREINLIKEGKKDLLASVNPSKGFATQNKKRCEDTIEELQMQVMMTGDDAIVATLNGMMEREDLHTFFEQLSIPKLMIFGSDDNYIPTQAAEQLIADHPSSQHVIIPSAGHMSFVEHPDQVVEALDLFLNPAVPLSTTES